MILDGQQRLTTLYLLISGDIPPYYRDVDILEDPRRLYFDLESGDFQYYQARRMDNQPNWIQVTESFHSVPPNVFEIARKKFGEDLLSINEKMPLYNDNLNALRSILDREYPIQYVPEEASVVSAIDVFDRVNRLGTKLNEAELALAHVTGKWPHARREMKLLSDKLKDKGFELDLNFMTRALTAVVKQRALYETIHDATTEELEKGWEDARKIIEYLIDIIGQWGYIHSTADLNSPNVLIPPIAFLNREGGRFPSERSIRHMIRWMYAASAWARYSGQTNQRLDQDVATIRQHLEPWDALINAIIDQRGRIQITPSDLVAAGFQSPFYKMAFVLFKRNGAVDWFNGSPISGGRGAKIHSHHIFPQSVLYKHPDYSSDNRIHRQLVNELANKAFLTADSNISVSDRLPADYLQEVNAKYPGALQSQFIPMDSRLWDVGNYDAFLGQRRTLIADAFNDLMESLAQDAEKAPDLTLAQLIETGESSNLEFKSSFVGTCESRE